MHKRRREDEMLLRASGLFGILIAFVVVITHGLQGYNPPPRLIAVGDLHGDLTNAKEILKFVQVIDCDGHWIAGRDTVIQVGDVLDRGPHGHEIIDFFDVLRKEAAASGGEFIQLLGNHELMNMQGDVKFVNPRSAEVFGGMERLKDAFDPVSGAYGSHLANSLDTAVIRNRTLFVHAGLLPEFAGLGVDMINKMVRRALLAKNFSDPILLNDGPLWTRQIIYPAQKGDCSNVQASLKKLSDFEVAHGRPTIDRMVIGHTIMQDGAIHTFCKGALVAIDIAVSQYFQGGGHLGVLELRYDFEHHSDHVSPYMQYPSNPFREHPLPPVQFPQRLPIPPFRARDGAKGVEGAALTIRSAGDSITEGELVILAVAFVVVVIVIASQRRDWVGHKLRMLGLRFPKLKSRDDSL